MKALQAISKTIDRVTESVGAVVASVVVLTIITGFANALLRKLGSVLSVTLINNELIQAQWYLFSLLFLLSFSYILKHNVNVRVDFLYSKWNARRRAIVDFVGTLLFLLVFCAIALYVTWGPVLTSFGRLPDGSFSGEWEVSGDAGGLTIAPLKALILVGFGLLLLQTLSQLIKYAAILAGHHEVDEAVMHAETAEELQIRSEK